MAKMMTETLQQQLASGQLLGFKLTEAGDDKAGSDVCKISQGKLGGVKVGLVKGVSPVILPERP